MKTITILGLLVLCALACWAVGDDYSSVSAEEIRSKVTRTVDYTIDKEVEYDIPLGTALKLKVAKNDLGIGEQFIYPKAEDGRMWIYTFDTSGKRLNRDGRDYKICKGMIDQLGSLPCASIVKWKADDKSAHVSFIISTDKARNRDEWASGLGGNSWTGSERLPSHISLTDRLTGFVRFWSEVKYNFPFFERMPDLDWDKVLVDYLPRIEKAETPAEYGDIMMECAALLRDGHTNYYGLGTPRPGLPVRVGCVSGKAIIEEVNRSMLELTDNGRLPPDTEYRDELLKANFKPGEEIVTVDGLAVKEKLERDVYRYISASTPQDRDLRAYPKLLDGIADSVATLTVRGLDGTMREVKMHRRGRLPGWPKNQFEFRKIGDDIGYLNLPGFGDKSIIDQVAGLADQFKTIKGLIIDIRRNGGGNSGYGNSIISHLIDKPLKKEMWKTRSYRPSFRAWGQKEEWYQSDSAEINPADDKYFLGPIVLLTGPATFSAAEDFTAVLHAGKRVTIVGEKTNGSTGQPLFIDLPMGGSARICTKWDAYPDGREFVGIGIIPDVEIGPTQEDIAKGRDAVLEKGIEVLKGLIGGNAK